MRTVRRFGVLSVAVVLTILYAILGLIFGIISAIIMAIATAVTPAMGGGIDSMMLGGVGFMAIIIYPIIFGAIGFHPWVQGKDKERLKVFEQFISDLSQRKDVTILPFKNVYEIYSKYLSDSLG